jgi:septal ring factor EnvC (AmiA/AmiB activator)
MHQCAGIKRDGGRCTAVVGPSQTHCYQHDPKRAEDRRRNASRAGKSKGNPKLAKLDRQLGDLATDTLAGDVERGVAAVVNQIINTRARLIEVERKIKEAEELEARLEALEDVLKRRTG